jgi:mevalonate pyrophosphate decarboxylase
MPLTILLSSSDAGFASVLICLRAEDRDETNNKSDQQQHYPSLLRRVLRITV